jgi:hypothetical protein
MNKEDKDNNQDISNMGLAPKERLMREITSACDRFVSTVHRKAGVPMDQLTETSLLDVLTGSPTITVSPADLLGYVAETGVDSGVYEDPSDLPASMIKALNSSNINERENAIHELVTVSPEWARLVSSLAELETISEEAAPVMAWLLVRNRWYIESRFKHTAYNKTSRADGLAQLVPSTRRALVAKRQGVFPWLSAVTSLSDGRAHSIVASILLGLASFGDFINAFKRHGVPSLIQGEVSQLPPALQTVIAITYYYHNGTSPTPYSRRAGVKWSDADKKKYEDLLVKEARVQAQTYSDALAGKQPPLIKWK